MNLSNDSSKKNLKNILLKYIRTKDNFNKFISSITNFINNEDQSKSWENYLLLIENEMISPFIDNEFLAGLTNTDDNLENILEIFNNGRISKKKYLIINDFNFSLYYGREDFDSYKNYLNIENEINRIISDIDNENILRTFFETYTNLTNTKEICEELFTMNNVFAKMFTNNNVVLYSALINYSSADFIRNPELKEFILKDKPVPENWDRLSTVFLNFLKEIDARTIHY